jgi:ribosome-binding factor A
MRQYSRAERVGGLIQQTVADILARRIKDPRLELATITQVKMTRDLRIARIYFSIAGGPEKVKAAEEGFKSAIGFLKRDLSHQLDLRYMPKIEFYYDDSFDYGSHIDNLLKSIATKND